MTKRPGPINAKNIFIERLIRIDSPPKSALDWLIEIIQLENWYSTESEAAEVAEKWMEQFLRLLQQEHRELYELGRVIKFTFNSSSDYILQGSAYVEPRDNDNVKDAKLRQMSFDNFKKALIHLHPREFEALCVGILKELGVENPTLTPYSADEGIDFFGKLHMKKLIFPNSVFPGIQHQLSVWIVGQAKHYKNNTVSTFEIRDLVGAVELAKGKAFGSAGEKYRELNMRVCDPVTYLFITTGAMTENSWRLIRNSGVAGMDGEMVASFLADRCIGVRDGTYSDESFHGWLRKLT